MILDQKIKSIALIHFIKTNQEQIITRKVLSEYLKLSQSSISHYISIINLFFSENHINLSIVSFRNEGFKLVNIQQLNEDEIKAINFGY